MSVSGKQRILDAFETLLNKNSLESITLKEIVELAGVNKTTFYYYYDSKDDILLSLIDEFTGGLDRTIAACFRISEHKAPREYTEEILHAFCGWYQSLYEKRNYLKMVYRSKYRQLLFDRFRELYLKNPQVTGAIMQVNDTPIVMNNMRCAYVYDAFASYMNSHIETWIRRNFEETPEMITELTLQDLSLLHELNNYPVS